MAPIPRAPRVMSMAAAVFSSGSQVKSRVGNDELELLVKPGGLLPEPPPTATAILEQLQARERRGKRLVRGQPAAAAAAPASQSGVKLAWKGRERKNNCVT